jgi:hypothetical protein
VTRVRGSPVTLLALLVVCVFKQLRLTLCASQPIKRVCSFVVGREQVVGDFHADGAQVVPTVAIVARSWVRAQVHLRAVQIGMPVAGGGHLGQAIMRGLLWW